MKRVCLLFAFALLCTLTVAADGKGDALLAQMSAKIKAMGTYEVVFNVSVGEFKSEGRYMVSGKAYQLTLGDVDVYCDGTDRYEINRTQEEITVDKINLSERNILNNPVGGLDFIGEEFSSAVVSQDEKATVVNLVRKQDANNTSIEVTVNTSTGLPTRIVYRMAGDAITVDLKSIRPSSAPLQRFDKSDYPGYEIIDFR